MMEAGYLRNRYPVLAIVAGKVFLCEISLLHEITQLIQGIRTVGLTLFGYVNLHDALPVTAGPELWSGNFIQWLAI